MSGEGDIVIEVGRSQFECKLLLIEFKQAKLRGPGPGRYKLPSTCGQNAHDFTKRMTPAFSFGKRLGDSLVEGVSHVLKTRILFFF